MSILVANCFHWVGFHLINEFLYRGIEVDGVDELETSKKEHLSMFVGRNDLFSLVPKNKLGTYQTAIIVEDTNLISSISSARMIKIGNENQRSSLHNVKEVQVPLLFGEWMPMTKKGCLYQERMIPFDSEEFMSSAIYVGDFVRAFMQWLELRDFPSHLQVCTKKNEIDEALKLENSIYIRDNVPIEENIQKVIRHFERYKQFY
ncbi:hypothetical protein ACFSTA_00090 [Ornithinibacillus salinisoli]|uniref:Uncharacterized protein n=1 Tax=Ornithinibacillus salinisoli TaxID=1848459 RepID=A0ABW4VVZ8_9BACI